MSEYFAARMLRTTEEMVRLRLRDLRSPELAPFYSGAVVPTGEAGARYAEASALRSASGLSTLTADEYLTQAGPPSEAFFLRFLDAVGIATENEDDLVAGPTVEPVPALGARSDFIKRRAATTPLSISTIRSAIRSRARPTAVAAAQLRPSASLAVADADPYVREKLVGMRSFVAGYLNQ